MFDFLLFSGSCDVVGEVGRSGGGEKRMMAVMRPGRLCLASDDNRQQGSIQCARAVRRYLQKRLNVSPRVWRIGSV